METIRVRHDNLAAPPWLATLRVALPYAVAFAAFLALRPAGPPVAWNDTATYLATAGEPVTSPAFYAGIRPPSVPLLYKLVGDDPARIVAAQSAIAVASWALLAWAVSLLVAGRLRPLAFAGTLLFALGGDVAQWDRVLISESLALSSQALVVAAGIWLLRTRRAGALVALLAALVLWVGTRDTNAYTLAFALVPVGILLVSRRALARYWLAAGLCALLCVGSLASARIGQRGMYPLYNSFAQRVLPYPERVDALAALGMPVSPALMARAGGWADSDDNAFYRDPALTAFRAWAERDGQSAYIRSLLADPARAALAPLTDLGTMLAPEVRQYAPGDDGAAYHVPALLNLAALTAIFLTLARLRRARPGVPTPAVAIVTLALLASLWVVWHGDAMEIGRHALTTAVGLRLLLWIGAMLALRHLPRLTPRHRSG